MKRIFTMSAALAFACSLFAVTPTVNTVLASYESPMGQEPITQTVFCETPPKSWVLFSGMVANPVKDETMNNTNNCYMVKLDANHDWWANFLDFRMTTPITITESNRYLHMLHYRSVLNDNWMLCLNTDWNLENSDKGKLRFDSQNSKAGVWEDIVIDLKYLIDNSIPLTKFMFGISMDWSDPKNNPGGDYYFDEIVLNNSPLPRGANILPDTEMSLFMGNTASYNKWVTKLDLQNSENTSEIVANPFTTQTAALNSTQVMKFNKSANASWWQGPRFKFPGLYTVGTNGSSYLHVMVNIPDMEAGAEYYFVQLNAKDYKGKEEVYEAKYWAEDKGKWKDIVLDATILGYVSEFTVRFDVRRDASDAYINSPAGSFYLDAVTINNSATERESVTAPTAVVNPSLSNIKVYSLDRNIVVEGDVKSIEIYNMLGKSIVKQEVNQEKSELPIQQGGVYLVKTVSTSGCVNNTKVLIK